jgi:hypothetical protein
MRIGIIYIYNRVPVWKKPEKDFFSRETRARSPRGGPTMGRSAERRPELVELADDSITISSTDAIPSRPPHEEQGQ